MAIAALYISELKSVPCSGCPASKTRKYTAPPAPIPSAGHESLVPVKLPSSAKERIPSAPTRLPTVTPEPVRQPTVIPEPVKQPTIIPEPVKEPSVVPEPVKEPTVVPEPVKEPSVVPEPVRQPTVIPEPVPEPVRQPTVVPEPVRQPTVVPEPVREPTVVPEPVRQPTVVPEPVPEPVREPTVVPEPVRQPTVVPEPVRQPTVVPEPVRQPTVVPEPVREPTVVPEPVRQPTVVPELVRQSTVVPEPVKEPSIVPEPVRQPTVVPEPVRQPTVVAKPVRQPTVGPELIRQPTVVPIQSRQPSTPRQPSVPPRQPTMLPSPPRQPTVAAVPSRQPSAPPRQPTMIRQPSLVPEPEPERQPTMQRQPSMVRQQEPSPTLYVKQTPQVAQPTYQSILKLCEKILNYCPCEGEAYDEEYLNGPCRGSIINSNLRCPFRGEDDGEDAPKQDIENRVPYRFDVGSGVTLCLDDQLRQFLVDPCPCSKKKELEEEEANRQNNPSAHNLGGPQDVTIATQSTREDPGTMENYDQSYAPRLQREPSLLRQVATDQYQYSKPINHKGRALAFDQTGNLYVRPSQSPRPGPYEQMIGPYKQIDSPYARMEGPFTRMEAPFSRMEAPYARMEAPYTRMETPYTRMETSYEQAGASYEQGGTPYEQIIAPFEQTSNPQGQRRGSSYGGSQKHMISYGQMGDTQRQRLGLGSPQGQKRGSSYGGSQHTRGSSYAQIAHTQGQLRRGYGQLSGSQAQASLCSYGPTRTPQAQSRAYPTAHQSTSRHCQLNSYGRLAPYGQYAGSPFGQAGATYVHLGGLQGTLNGFSYGQIPGPQSQLSDGAGQIGAPFEQITGSCYLLQTAGPSNTPSGIMTPTYFRNPQRNKYADNNMIETEDNFCDYRQETGANTLINPPESRYRKELRKMKSAIVQTMSRRKLKRRSQISRDAAMNPNL